MAAEKSPGNSEGKPSIEDLVEARFDDLLDPEHADSDRPTPVMAEPPPQRKASSDSQKATKPAEGVDIPGLFRLNNLSSLPPEGGVAVSEVAAVITGAHQSLKPSPIPRVYTGGESLPPGSAMHSEKESVSGQSMGFSEIRVIGEPDPGPEIEVTETEMDIDENGDPLPVIEKLSLEKFQEIVNQCLSIFKEMDLDFSSIYEHAVNFEWKEKHLDVEQINSAVMAFLKQITHHLATYLLEDKTNIIQTRIGILSEKLLMRIAQIDDKAKEGGKVVCDGNTLKRFQIVKELIDGVPVLPCDKDMTETFVSKVSFVGILMKA